MQSNQVSISCVYPCVLAIQNKLSEENAELMYTKQLRKDLLESLNKRFGDLIESDLCLISSFLDSRFGPKAFSSEKREKVKMRLKYHLGLINPRSKTNNIQTYTFTENISSKFLFYQVEAETSISSFDDYDIFIKQYIDYVLNLNIEDPLLFWKENAFKYPELSILAKKFLGVPASEADVERCFNISGFIHNPKRRSLGVENYENLVFTKLNEIFL
jgi:hypothetical protein